MLDESGKPRPLQSYLNAEYSGGLTKSNGCLIPDLGNFQTILEEKRNVFPRSKLRPGYTPDAIQIARRVVVFVEHLRTEPVGRIVRFEHRPENGTGEVDILRVVRTVFDGCSECGSCGEGWRHKQSQPRPGVIVSNPEFRRRVDGGYNRYIPRLVFLCRKLDANKRDKRCE